MAQTQALQPKKSSDSPSPKRKRKFKPDRPVNKLVETVRLSSLTAKGNALKRLQFENERLIPLSISIADETAEMTYDLSDTFPFEGIQKESAQEQYRLLANVQALEVLAGQYSFSLAPDNLRYDRNLQVQVIRRDLFDGDGPYEGAEAGFLSSYKSLCGHVLQNKYDFEAFENGGESLLDKYKLLKEVRALKSGEELSRRMFDLYDKERAVFKLTKRPVGKFAYAALLTCLALAIALTALCAAYAGNFLLNVAPFNRAVISAGNAFIASDYDGVIEALRGIGVEKLPKESRYVLSRAYVQSESLSQEQKTTILNGLTLKTDDRILDYWVHVGRREYEHAKDIAQRVQDDELLLYCLIKQETDVANDAGIAGAEKAALLDSLGKEIESLSKKLAEPAKEAEK